MKIHLIGIGGTGMGALAGLLASAGHEVRGSDGPLYPPMSTLLSELGIPLFEGYRPENLDWQPDRVVVGNICRKDHPEAVAAKERGLVLISFPALLSELFLAERHPVVIAGTHGKTTTATLMTHVLTHAGLAPGYLVGGVPAGGGTSFGLGAPPYFVLEGDEYDTAFFDKRPKFVHYRPKTVILTSVEFDHADIYASLDAVKAAFAMLVDKVPQDGRILVCADYPAALEVCAAAACPVETYSVNQQAHWQGRPAGLSAQGQRMEISRGGEPAGTVTVPMSGRHNLANALAVIAAASHLTVSAAAAAAGVKRFGGVRRRQEVRGEAGGVTVIDDFAHHPTAILETLSGLKERYAGRRLWAAFEPRSATSRRNVFQQTLPQALAVADQVVLGPLHAPEGIAADERLDLERVVADLQAQGTPASAWPDPVAVADHLAARCAPGDVVVVMSSGSFGGLVDRLLGTLAARGSTEVMA